MAKRKIKGPKPKAPEVVREFLREIGSRGGKAQSIEDKRAAVNKRWAAYRARQKPKTP